MNRGNHSRFTNDADVFSGGGSRSSLRSERLSSPLAARAGKLLVAAFNSGGIIEITAEGNFAEATSFATGLSGPRNFLELPGGQLLVAEYSPGEITNVTAGGDFTGASPLRQRA